MMNINGWPIQFISDPTVPENELQLRRGNRIVGRITNIQIPQVGYSGLACDANAALKTYNATERKQKINDLKAFYVRAEIEGLLQSGNHSDPAEIAAMLDRIEKIIKFND